MSRTKQEVREFLDSKVGHVCADASDKRLNGQCVCLIKNLMDFLGVPNPYAARGDATNAGSNYIAQGIGSSGRGWLTVVVNHDMGLVNGFRYGHIWIDLQGEANYESNGARALYVTKNTRPVTQGQQFINFDKWIRGDDDMIQDGDTSAVRIIMSEVEGWDMDAIHSGKEDGRIMGWKGHRWTEFIYHAWQAQNTHRGHLSNQISALNKQIAELSARPTQAQVDALKTAALAAQAEADKALKAAAESKEATDKLIAEKQAAEDTGNAFMQWLGAQLNKLLGKK